MRIKLKNIEGYASYIGQPSKELEEAVNKMAELAFYKTSKKNKTMPQPDQHLQFLDPNRHNDFINQFKPIGMKCEVGSCLEKTGQDYHRLPSEQVKGWESEPIFLCHTHAIGHEPIKK